MPLAKNVEIGKFSIVTAKYASVTLLVSHCIPPLVWHLSLLLDDQEQEEV